MEKNVRFFYSVAVIVISVLAVMGVGLAGPREGGGELPDLFVHDSITIPTGQSLGKLMVASGNAQVAGKVTDGILVIDGKLTIQAGAAIAGRIIVLGGSATIEPGADVEHKPWVIVPQGHPMVPIVVMLLFIAGAASLLLLPLLLWISGHLFTRTVWYPPIKERFLAVERRWPVLYIAASLGISALMLLAFSALAWETLFRQTLGLFDDSFIWLIRYFANPSLDQLMISITDIGFGTSYIFIVAASFLLLAYHKRWREMSALAICLAGGATLSLLLKSLFHRARPDVFRVVAETGYSFPSGHAMATMCFYGMAAFIVMRLIASWRGRLAIVTLTVILSMAIGISRIYLGVHYPSDVVAGYAAGSMWLAFCISLLLWWEKEREKKLSTTRKS